MLLDCQNRLCSQIAASKISVMEFPHSTSTRPTPTSRARARSSTAWPRTTWSLTSSRAIGDCYLMVAPHANYHRRVRNETGRDPSRPPSRARRPTCHVWRTSRIQRLYSSRRPAKTSSGTPKIFVSPSQSHFPFSASVKVLNPCCTPGCFPEVVVDS